MANPFSIPPYSEAFLLGKATDTRLAVIIDLLLGISPAPTPPVIAPGVVPANSNYATGIIVSHGKSIAVSGKLSTIGTLTIQRYIDAAGTIPIGDPIVQAMAANTLATVAVYDGLPYASWQATITNTTGGASNLTQFALLERN